MKQNTIEGAMIIGYFKEFYVGNQFIGKETCEKDRETIGYAGKQSHIADADFKVGKKRIKAGEKYVTILYPYND
jgi:hypothetical protein